MMELEVKHGVSMHPQHDMSRDPQIFQKSRSYLKILDARIGRSSLPSTHKY
jgi:hypothetical protein